jgi:octopine/nopaline transport system permease protein
VTYWELMGFGPNGWGYAMVAAAGVTFAVSVCALAIGGIIGSLLAWAKLAGPFWVRAFADGYTTVLRGVPDLLVIYLFYFGGSALLSSIGRLFGADGFIGLPAFATGAAAVGVVSGAYQAEVLRGAYTALNRGELEAARSVGMHRWLMFRRIIAPQVLRYAIPGLGNVWQLALKESALISVTGVVELLRQSAIGAGSTRQPFSFYITAAMLYLVITTVSSWGFSRAETYSMRGIRRA